MKAADSYYIKRIAKCVTTALLTECGDVRAIHKMLITIMTIYCDVMRRHLHFLEQCSNEKEKACLLRCRKSPVESEKNCFAARVFSKWQFKCLKLPLGFFGRLDLQRQIAPCQNTRGFYLSLTRGADEKEFSLCHLDLDPSPNERLPEKQVKNP